MEKYCNDKPKRKRRWKLNDKQLTIRKWGGVVFGVMGALHLAEHNRYVGYGYLNRTGLYSWWAAIVVVTIVLIFVYRDKTDRAE